MSDLDAAAVLMEESSIKLSDGADQLFKAAKLILTGQNPPSDPPSDLSTEDAKDLAAIRKLFAQESVALRIESKGLTIDWREHNNTGHTLEKNGKRIFFDNFTDVVDEFFRQSEGTRRGPLK